MHIAGLSFLEAVQDITGEPPPTGNLKPLTEAQKAERNRERLEAESRQRALKAKQQAYEDDTQQAAGEIWNNSVEIEGTAAEKYLKLRGMDDLHSRFHTVMRFHPALPYHGKTRPYRGSRMPR